MKPKSSGFQPIISPRPLSLGGVLRQIIRLYRDHFWLFAALGLVPIVPTFLLQIGAGPTASGGNLVALVSHATGSPIAPSFGLLAFGYLGMFVLAPLSSGLVPGAAIDAVLGESPSFGSILRRAGRRYWGLLALTLANALAGLLILFLGLGILLWVCWSVAVPALLAERIPPGRALRRSFDLIEGSFWRILGTLVLVLLFVYAVEFALGALASLIAVAVPSISLAAKVIVVAALQTLGSAVVGQTFVLCQVCLYFDLRVRKEGFRVDGLAGQAGADAAA